MPKYVVKKAVKVGGREFNKDETVMLEEPTGDRLAAAGFVERDEEEHGKKKKGSKAGDLAEGL